MYRELFDFIEKAPTAFQAVSEFRTRLLKDGAEELREDAPWQLRYGQTYFITRNDSALVVFSIPEEGEEFRVFAAHSDSPSFKVKENPEIVVEDKYVKLNVEPYGGMICSTWLDRPLSVAGRLIVRDGDSFRTVLVDVDRDLLIIPNVAIHQNREVNKGYEWNMQTDMLPLLGGIGAKGSFMKIVAEHAGVREEDILGHDLFLYIREKGRVFGANGEYMAGSRFDDIECALAGFLGFRKAARKRYIPVLMIFDNEEVGSQSRQGAGSTFLLDPVERIAEELPRQRPRAASEPSGKMRPDEPSGPERRHSHQIRLHTALRDRRPLRRICQKALRRRGRSVPDLPQPLRHGRRRHARIDLHVAGGLPARGHRPHGTGHALCRRDRRRPGL